MHVVRSALRTVQDHVALAEIELCGELMIAASAAREERLSPDRIDEVLQVGAERRAGADDPAGPPPGGRTRAAARAVRRGAAGPARRQVRSRRAIASVASSTLASISGAALDGGVGDAVPQVLLQQLEGEGLQGLGGRPRPG